MKKYLLFVLQIVFAIALVSCDDKDDPTPPKPKPTPKINPVSQFVYDGMSVYYKWADQMLTKKPTSANSDPEKYFYNLRSKPDIEHGWSWITDDVESLLKGFSGESFSFGYNLLFTRVAGDNKVYAFVKFVFPNSPASEAGMERLHLIGEINGTPIGIEEQNGKTLIAKKDINVLYGKNQATFTLYKIKDGVAVKDKDVTVTPKEINTNPILKDSIYTVGGKTIGYILYNSFISNYNEKLFESFSKFKNAGVNELVLDLRYNRGGALSAASYLASMIAPTAAVQNKEILSTLSYNDNINALFDKKGWSRSSRLGVYDNKKFSNPLEANLNLSKVYIIATKGSYSASELTTFCLKPYLEVVHIGNKTGGKYTASWTLHPYKGFSGRAQPIYEANEVSAADKKALQNWAMQPIVAVYTNKNGETFMETDGLIPESQNTLKEGFGRLRNWTKLGDTKDTFLGQALYLITGDEKYKPVPPAATKAYSPVSETIELEPVSLSDKIQQESVLIDTMPEMLQK